MGVGVVRVGVVGVGVVGVETWAISWSSVATATRLTRVAACARLCVGCVFVGERERESVCESVCV